MADRINAVGNEVRASGRWNHKGRPTGHGIELLLTLLLFLAPSLLVRVKAVQSGDKHMVDTRQFRED